jgi:hypothetical protein
MTSSVPQTTVEGVASPEAATATAPDGGASARREESFRAPAQVNSAAGGGRGGPARRRRKPNYTDGPFTESKELLGGAEPPSGARR